MRRIGGRAGTSSPTADAEARTRARLCACVCKRCARASRANHAQAAAGRIKASPAGATRSSRTHAPLHVRTRCG
eukprot:5024529-Pleurochrysis_carterae.AAC.2